MKKLIFILPSLVCFSCFDPSGHSVKTTTVAVMPIPKDSASYSLTAHEVPLDFAKGGDHFHAIPDGYSNTDVIYIPEDSVKTSRNAVEYEVVDKE